MWPIYIIKSGGSLRACRRWLLGCSVTRDGWWWCRCALNRTRWGRHGPWHWRAAGPRRLVASQQPGFTNATRTLKMSPSRRGWLQLSPAVNPTSMDSGYSTAAARQRWVAKVRSPRRLAWLVCCPTVPPVTFAADRLVITSCRFIDGEAWERCVWPCRWRRWPLGTAGRAPDPPPQNTPINTSLSIATEFSARSDGVVRSWAAVTTAPRLHALWPRALNTTPSHKRRNSIDNDSLTPQPHRLFRMHRAIYAHTFTVS